MVRFLTPTLYGTKNVFHMFIFLLPPNCAVAVLILNPVFPGAFTDYGVQIIGGSMFDIIHALTVQTEEELEVQCCDQGALSNATTTCGNGVSCVAICGDKTTKGKTRFNYN